MNLKNLKVLIVEDEIVILESLGATLRDHGAELRLAKKYIEGIKAFHEQNPDVVLTDLKLHDHVDGIGLARSLRSLGFNGAIIAITGYPLEHRVEKGDFDAYFSKPLDEELIIEYLSKFKK